MLERHLLGPLAAAAAAHRWCRETMQVRSRVFVELERSGERVEDMRGGVLVTALLEPDVVIGADAGEHRDLLAAQARDPSVAAGVRKLDIFGTNELPPGAEVLADRILTGHGTTIRLCGAAILALRLPGSAEPLFGHRPGPRINA